MFFRIFLPGSLVVTKMDTLLAAKVLRWYEENQADQGTKNCGEVVKRH
jgi:hypothetical protein